MTLTSFRLVIWLRFLVLGEGTNWRWVSCITIPNRWIKTKVSSFLLLFDGARGIRSYGQILYLISTLPTYISAGPYVCDSMRDVRLK
jgi:hypothetical protein